MKKASSFLTISLFAICGNAFGQVFHSIPKNQNVVITHKISNKVLQPKGRFSNPNTRASQADYVGASAQQFKLVDAGGGNYFIVSKDNLLLSLKFDLQSVAVQPTTAIGSRILVFDQKYIQKLSCEISESANCPKHQTWRIEPVIKESQTFTIKSATFNDLTVQPQANSSNVNASITRDPAGENDSKWLIVKKDDLLLAPLATPAEIIDFENIADNQSGVAILSGDTTKPFYYHHNKPNQNVFKYKKVFNVPFEGEETISAWFPVEEFRKTLCGEVSEYKQQKQDIEHDGTFNLDIDANLHIQPNRKFSFMLTNRLMDRYANDRFFNERVNIYCALSNCSITFVKKSAEDRAKEDVRKLLEGFNTGAIEVEFTPAMLGNPKDSPDNKFMTPLNPLFSFNGIGLGKDHLGHTRSQVCAHGPWMWERILVSDLPFGSVLDFFKNDHFNNEIHPANQIWFRDFDTLNLIALVDQTGYFEIPKNPSNKTEVHASGLNQRMRFHVGFKLSAAFLFGDPARTTEYQINAKGFKYNDVLENEVRETVRTFKYKNALRLTIRDNSFLKSGNTHRVFVENVRRRPDGTIQGFIVVETAPITRRGGSINVFVTHHDS